MSMLVDSDPWESLDLAAPVRGDAVIALFTGDRDHEFFRWVADHKQDGYLINEATWTLHHAACGHITDTSTPHITRAPKYCSVDPAELREYAQFRSEKLMPCGSCHAPIEER